MDSTGQQQNEAFTFSFVGGDLSVDLTNTLEGRLDDESEERLTGYPQLVEWGEQAGIVSHEQAARLLGEAALKPSNARTALGRAIKLREALYRLFLAISMGRQPKQNDLDVVNAAVARAMTHARLVRDDEGKFAWGWEEAPDALDAVLWPVARSAADLLVSGNLGRVKQCAADTCGWLFVDTTRNGSRQWCDMSSCGNKAKARRHYHRTKQCKTAD